MARKKDLQGAITRGADLFFSANDQPQEVANAEQAQHIQKAVKANDVEQLQEANNDEQAQHAQEVLEVQDVIQLKQPYKAQDVSEEALTSTIEAMQDRIAAAEERRTQGRKGYKMPRLNISLTPSGMDYVKIMAGITGKSVTQYISDVVEKDAIVNAERYQKAKELMKDVR